MYDTVRHLYDPLRPCATVLVPVHRARGTRTQDHGERQEVGRHCLATNLMHCGTGLLVIKKQMGHVYLGTMMRHIHSDPERMRQEYVLHALNYLPFGCRRWTRGFVLQVSKLVKDSWPLVYDRHAREAAGLPSDLVLYCARHDYVTGDN